MTSEQTTGNSGPPGQAAELEVVSAPDSRAAQAYRAVRESIRHARADQPIRSVLLANPGTRTEAGVAVANLGASFALNGDATVIVDTDVANPVLHEVLNTSLSPGLIEWLSSRSSGQGPEPVETSVEALSLLPAGTRSGGTQRSMSDLLTGDACERLAGDLGTTARYVLFHAPPLSDSSEALTIGASVDAVLLVIRSGTTKRTDAQRAKESLERVGARILGVVLTDT